MAYVAAAALVVTVLSTAVSVYGQQQQSKAVKAQSEYQAAVGRNNAIIAERQAQDAIARGKEAERLQRMETQRLIGRQRAALAGSGQVVDEGSALDITSDSAAFGEFEALTVRNNAQREAYGYRARAAGFESEATLADFRGAAAQSAAKTQQFSTVLDGASSVAGIWSSYKNATPKTSGALVGNYDAGFT